MKTCARKASGKTRPGSVPSERTLRHPRGGRDAADAVLEMAQEEGVDLIVMRAPKRRWWRPILAGSVTDTVIRESVYPSTHLGRTRPDVCQRMLERPTASS